MEGEQTTRAPTRRRDCWFLQRCVFCLLLPLLVRVAHAVNHVPVEGHVYLSQDVPPPTTKVTLNGGVFTTLTRLDGSFSFPEVPAGTYLLEVLSSTHYFSQIKMSIRPESEEQVLCIEYKYPGAQKLKTAYPLVITAHSEYSYFEKRDPWAALRGHLYSPMTWMMLASVAMAFLFPKMLSNMDEDQKQALEQQFKASNPQSLMEELLGGGAPKKKEEAKRD